MSEVKSIQWFPGHMTKARRKIQANLKLVDAVIEIIDARIPISSRNPEINKIIQSKPRIILLNKSDMADANQTKNWIQYYKNKNIYAIDVDCRSGKGLNKLLPTLKEALRNKIDSWNKKGMINRSIRVMIVGIPNVGKSSLVNKLLSKSKAKAEDRPGVTRGNQWFSVGKELDLLDTPGVLWPKFNDKSVGEKLAFTGAIKDQILDIEELAIRLINYLLPKYEKNLIERYKLKVVSLKELNEYDVLKIIAKKRGMLISGGEVDLERASIMLLDEFRSARIGNITLETV